MANALGRWGMFKAPQGSIVTCCFTHTARCQSMLNWRAPSSPACGAYGNDEDDTDAQRCPECDGTGRVDCTGYIDDSGRPHASMQCCEACEGLGFIVVSA